MKILRMKVIMIVEKTDTGFSAYSEQHPIFTTAVNITELMNNALEAVNFYFEEDGFQLLIKISDLKSILSNSFNIIGS